MCGIIFLIQLDSKNVDLQQANKCLNELVYRGPDKTSYQLVNIDDKINIFMGFTRLAIMDTSDSGLQPFVDHLGNSVICNGEIYNYKDLAIKYSHDLTSQCDCEIILPLFRKIGFKKMVSSELDAEFATVILDRTSNKIYAARDRYGVRPLYYGYNTTSRLLGFASELKALHSVMEFVEQVSPDTIMSIKLKNDAPVDTMIKRHIYYSFDNIKFSMEIPKIDTICSNINKLLTAAVKKRLNSDRPIGFFLSGGLDSSLIVAIATRILGPDKIVCFSIGLDGSPDVEASKKVVEYLGIRHHHIIPFNISQGFAELPNVIRAIETYDVTTIRASTPQYIMAKYINENTDIRVVLSGEGSDEIHGSYRYFRDAPNGTEFHRETIRLLRDLTYFDNQRTDRTSAHWGLEVRVPFLDFEYVEFITQINPHFLMFRPDYMEKMIVRNSFRGYLPDEILYRSKEAFSDAVSNNEFNWANHIKTIAETTITDDEFTENSFDINKPKTKDALFFRNIFHSFYQNRDNVIPYYWLPKFQREEVVDPSARVLKCY